VPSQKQKTERAVWKRIHGFLEVPPAQEDPARYMAVRRQVEKMAGNPEFIRDAKKEFANFRDFLVNYDLNVADLDLWDNLLNMEMTFRRRKK
jgi:hypothetical protein